jgi:hypothetical protein
MPDNIYPGAETHLITDRDNDLIMGICRSAAAPTHAGPSLPGKKPHALSKNLWTDTKAANIFTSIQGQGSRISHAPPAMTGQGKAKQGIHPPIRELQVRVRGKPAWPHRPPRRLRSEVKPTPPGSGLRNPIEYHTPHHQEASRTGSNTIEAFN